MNGPTFMIVEASQQLSSAYAGVLILFAVSAIGILWCTSARTAIRQLVVSLLARRVQRARPLAVPVRKRRAYPFALGQNPWCFGWVVGEVDAVDLLANRRRRR